MTGRRAGGSASRGGASFGARLRELREAAGLSQEELASKANLSPSAVAALEQGRRKRPYPHTVRSLAEALGLSEDERRSLLSSVPARGGATVEATPPVEAAAPPSAALPHPATPLLGREREVGEVGGLLLRSDVRLVTLTGVGGVGKTRLALEVTRGAAGDFPDGAAFVGLAPLSDPALVLPTIVRTLGLREGEGRGPDDVLRTYLGEKDFLLVLDNFEHLLGAATEVAGLIEACPGLVVLANSRAPLRVRGEREYPVPPLALPASTRSPAEEEVLAAPSGRLFVERARAVSPGFTFTRDNTSSVAAICWRLAGIPLALELAAAKARFLDPAALLLRLDEALSTAGARDLPERQRTMQAALDWSHGLLSEPEQRLLRRLSVFAGGFTLSAAEAVGAVDGEGALGLLGGLVEQSLVEAEPDPEGGVRYGMLEPVRQYALGKLEENGETREARRHHAAYYLALTEEAEPELRGPRQAEWLGRLETEHGNLRAALSWSLERGDAALGLRMAAALWLFWFMRGHLSEGRRWLEGAVSRSGPVAKPARAKALEGAGRLSVHQGEYGTAKALVEEGLAFYRELGDEEGVASSLASLGFVAVMGQRDDVPVAALLEEARELRPKLKDRHTVADLILLDGLAAMNGGYLERAVALHEEGLGLFREMGDVQGMGACLLNLATLAGLRGDHEGASALLRENLRVARKADYKLAIHLSFFGLGLSAAFREQPARAARLWGAAEAVREASGMKNTPLARSFFDPAAYVSAVRSGLGEEAFAAAWEEGRAMALEQAVAYALGRDFPDRPNDEPNIC